MDIIECLADARYKFIIDISNYILGNLSTDEIPKKAEKILEYGYDTPSLCILAGLDSYFGDIEYYLKLTLEEMNIKIEDKKTAGLILIRHYIEQIVNEKINSIKGIENIIFDVLMKTSCFESENDEYIYQPIGLTNLYSLYYAYDEVLEYSQEFLDKPKDEIIKEIEEEIIKESIELNNNMDYNIIV